MPINPGFELPFGIQPTNPVPVDAWSGPFTAASLVAGISAANAAIPSAVRFKSMEVRLIVGGASYKYWYANGITDTDLIPFFTDYVSSFNGLTGAVTGVTTGTANTFVPVQTFSGGINATGATLTSPVYISGLGIPTTDTQAANKAYVDSVASVGIHYHDAVVLASTDSETFNTGVTYNNGTSGVGATLRKTASFARINIDSTNGSTGERILIRSAATQQWNGVYSVTNQGDGTTGWILTRTADTDNYHPYENDGLGANDYFFVTSGSSLKNTAYICNNVGGITFGTTAITFAVFSIPPVYTAGTGLALNSLQFSNTGVLSFNGSTGAVTGVSSIRGLTGTVGLTNGNGIDLSVSGNTLTVSNSGVLTVNGLTGTVTNVALTTGKLSQFASTTSAELAGVISNETGSGGVLVFNSSPAITTSITTASTSFSLVNTIATTLNLGGAATTLTMGGTSGTASIRNSTLLLGNTNNTITTNSGTTNYLSISPYGNVLLQPTTTAFGFGTITSVAVTNAVDAVGQVQIAGGDLYLGVKSTDGNDSLPVNIIFEGATDNTNETTLTVVDPTADRTITFPDASGTVALTSGIVSLLSGSTYISVSGSTGAVTITNTGVQTFNGLTGAVTGVTTGTANTFGPLQSFTSGISASGATFSGDIAVNGGDITTTSATATLYNTTATTVNIGNAASTVNLMGATANTRTGIGSKCYIKTGQTTTTTTAKQEIFRYTSGDFIADTYFADIIITANFAVANYPYSQITKMLVVSSLNTSINHTEYGNVNTSGNLAVYTAELSGTNVIIYATPTGGFTTTFNVYATLIKGTYDYEE